MSGIAGIIHFDGKPVEPGLIECMTSAMAHRGPDGINHWVKGSVALGQCMLRTTPESLEEHQPLSNEDESLVLVMDGRVDNWQELRRDLLAHGAVLRDRSDAELVLRAFEVWGDKSPYRILGDFAYVVWDRTTRQLFCCRDVVGLRPFYYYWNGVTFLFCTELQVILKHPDVRRDPNEGMIAEYLSAAIRDREETLYRNILRLPAAHYLKVRCDLFTMQRYWDVDSTHEIRYSTDSQYAQHFEHVFAEAVRCRLRSGGPVSAEMSGGVDSSSIVAFAQAHYRSVGRAESGFETFALGFPGLSCDERAFAHSMVQMWNLTHHTLPSTVSESSWFIRETRRSGDFTPYPTWAAWDVLSSLIQERGFRVILNGAGGDEWLTGSISHYADFLRHFKLSALIRQVRSDRQFAARESVPAIIFPSLTLLRAGLWPLVPTGIRRVVKSVVRSRPTSYGPLGRGFARRTRLGERLAKRNSDKRFPTHAQQSIYGRLAESGWMPHGIEMRDRLDGLHGRETRFPFMDRRIIEFCLAVPDAQLWRGYDTKYVLRNAMRGFLPELIRWRRTKADFSHVFLEAFRTLNGARHFSDLTIASLGWIDGAKVAVMYSEMVQSYQRKDLAWLNYVWLLWMVLGIEIWYKEAILDERFEP